MQIKHVTAISIPSLKSTAISPMMRDKKVTRAVSNFSDNFIAKL